MKEFRAASVILFLALLVTSVSADAAVFTSEQGTWPRDWPKVLEPLRENAKTIGVATGIQQDIHVIPIPDQATFEKVWPAVLEIRSPNGSLTLESINEGEHPTWGHFLENRVPTIRIFAPTGGIVGGGEFKPETSEDWETLLKSGKALRASGPWPQEILGPNGEVPEYILSEEREDGKLRWTPANPFEDSQSGKLRGFYHRARIDIEIVVDGQIIDLNRTRLPEGGQLIDRRFPAE